MEYKAILRYARISPRKLRLVVDLIRGKNVHEALELLSLTSKRGAYFLIKLVKSALANATVNPDVNEEQLYLAKVIVGEGPILKRWRAAPRGRGVPIKKRMSHATVVLGEKPVTK